MSIGQAPSNIQVENNSVEGGNPDEIGATNNAIVEEVEESAFALEEAKQEPAV